MNKKIIALALLSMLSSCLKKPALNENALLQERACIESLNLSDHARALRHCELCLEFNKSSPECLNGIGLIAFNDHDEDKAINYFSKALRQNNDFSQARNNLGVVYYSRGDFDMGLKYFDRALAIDPSNTDARNNKGLSHLRLAQRFKAQGFTKESLSHLASAYDQVNKLLALDPSYASAYRDLGVIELNRSDLAGFEEERMQKLSSAKRAFELCLSLENDNDGCFEGLGQVYFEQGLFDQSFAHYFSCLSHAPKNSSCRTGIVQSFEKSAHFEGGYQAFKHKLLKEPHNAPAHEAFCAALFERGLDREAREQCEIALKLDTSLCQAHYRLADHYAALLDAEQASRHCRAFLVCDSGTKNMSFQNKCREILVSLSKEPLKNGH